MSVLTVTELQKVTEWFFNSVTVKRSVNQIVNLHGYRVTEFSLYNCIFFIFFFVMQKYFFSVIGYYRKVQKLCNSVTIQSYQGLQSF